MKQAGSMMLLRCPEDVQVFWVQRAKTARFLSGFYAFPGGWVEPEDAREGIEAARIAAIRETAEETGYVLKTPPEQLISAGCCLAPTYLVTPFLTQYYAAWVPDDLALAIEPNDELAGGEWIYPRDAVAAWRRGEVLLAPPTLALLKALSMGAAKDAALFEQALQSRDEARAQWSQIRPHITLIPLRTPTLPPATHTNTYLVGDQVLAIIDPAAPSTEEQARLDALIDARIAEGARIRAIILTHHHWDHIGGVEHLADRLGVPVLAHPETASRVSFRVDGYLDEGDIVDLDQHQLRVLHTPGHAPGHLCFIDESTKTAIVGDMVAGIGTILIEPNDGDMCAYLHSLARLRDRYLSALLPSHGPVIGGATEWLEYYIEHRLMREQKVLDALTLAGDSIGILVERVYDDAPAMAKMGPNGGLAGLSLQAHLHKLHGEGRAVRQGEQWRASGE